MLGSLCIHCFDQARDMFCPDRSPPLTCCAQLPAAGWSIIGIENRNVKLLGTWSRKSCVHASRVGNQCLVSGVSLHTAKILIRWSTSCTSPESCHLNHLDFLELIRRAIAPTHSGDLIASSLLY
jgi:hypothetical protein